MAKRKGTKKTDEELQTENELMKLKMMAEFGGNFMGNEDVPAEVENQFLKQIIRFHKKHSGAPLVTVYEFLGSPTYLPVKSLNEQTVLKPLAELLKQMSKKGVEVESLSNVTPLEIYRFITEDLFPLEIENVHVRGWANRFVYEEFYPNPDMDVLYACQLIVMYLHETGMEPPEQLIDDEVKDYLGLTMHAEGFIEAAEAFKAKVYKMRFVNYEISNKTVEMESGFASIDCRVHYEVQDTKGKRYRKQTHDLTLEFMRNEEVESLWQLTCVQSELIR